MDQIIGRDDPITPEEPNNKRIRLKEGITGVAQTYKKSCTPRGIRRDLETRLKLTWGGYSKAGVKSTEWRKETAQSIPRCPECEPPSIFCLHMDRFANGMQALNFREVFADLIQLDSTEAL